MNLPAASAIALLEEPATAGKGVASAQNPLSEAGAGAPFFETIAQALGPQAPPAERVSVSAAPGPPGGGQDLAASGNSLPAASATGVAMPDLRLMDPVTPVSVGDADADGELRPAAPGAEPLPGAHGQAAHAAAATSAAQSVASQEATIAARIAALPGSLANTPEVIASVPQSLSPEPSGDDAKATKSTPATAAPQSSGADSEAIAALRRAASPASPGAAAQAFTTAPVTFSPAPQIGATQAAAATTVTTAIGATGASTAPEAATATTATTATTASRAMEVTAAAPAVPRPLPPAAALQPVTAAPAAPSPVPPTSHRQAATAAYTLADPRLRDSPPKAVMPPLEALGEGRRQWPAEQASAPLFGPRLAPPYAAPGATSVPPAVTAETATPVLGTLNRAHLEGTPELNMVAAKPLSTADGVAGPFERRAHLATAFDDGDRAGPLPAFARASMQSPLAEPSAPLPALARAALALPAGLQQPGWNQALGERVVWLLSHDVQRAELTLNPPELGALRVRVTVTGQAASVAFASEHAPVREAVESALPQLRQVLAERGLSLDHVDVSPQQSGQRWTHGGSDSPAERQRQLAERDAVSVNEAGPAPVSLQRGLVDQYA